MIKKLMLSFALVGALSTVASAGYTVRSLVGIHPATSSASGTLSAVAENSDSVAYIGCAVVTSASSGSYARCAARNFQGTTKLCLSYDANIIATVRSISSSSHISFAWDESTGKCTSLLVSNSSMHL